MNDSESDQLPGHETSQIATDLENLQQEGFIMQTNVSPEVLEDVSDTGVLEKVVVRDVRSSAMEDVTQNGPSSIVLVHTKLAKDGTIDGSNLDNTKDTLVCDSALEGMKIPYVMYPQFDIDVLDVPMTDKVLDDGDEHFVFPALDREKEMVSWQASRDVSMEEERLANHDLEQHVKRGCSPTYLGTTRNPEANADIFGDSAAIQNIAVETPLGRVENQTNPTNAFENVSIHQFKLDQHRNHPVTDLENTDNFNSTDSNAESIQGNIETAMVSSGLGTREKDEVDSIMECNEGLVEDVEPPSQSCLGKEERVQDGAARHAITVHDVEVGCADVASIMEVHLLDFEQVERENDDQLPLLDEGVATEIHGGDPLMCNEEELIEAASAQVEGEQADGQVDVPEADDRKKGKQVEVVPNGQSEGSFREEEEADKMQVEEPAHEWVVSHNGHQDLVETCSVQGDIEEQEEKQDVMYSMREAELGTPPTLVAEHVHPCHHLDEETKEEEKVLESLERSVGKEECTLSSMEDEALPEKHAETLDGYKVPREASLRTHKGSIPNAEEIGVERDEGDSSGKSPSAAGEKIFRKKRNKAHEEVSVFGVGDMVWAKVRSHPWWPAQIFDAADASKAAREVKKPGRALVAFYGDCTFTWLEQSQLIAFRPNFEEKVAQTTMRSFCVAVEEALEEFCRRSELGLHCDHYKGPPLHRSRSTFPAANTGIRKGVKLETYQDMSTNIRMFRPEKVLEFVKGVVCSPLDSWSSTLSFSELRGHAYGVRSCMVALEVNEGDTLLQRTIRKVKRSYTSLKDDKEHVVGGGKQGKKPKLGRGRRSSAGGGEHASSSSLNKARRHTIGDEPATPTRRESKAEATFVHTPPYSDMKVLGTRRMKKHFVVSEIASWYDSIKKAKAINDVPTRKHDDGKNVAERVTPKKLIKVGDSIKKVAGHLTGMAPAKHAEGPSAKNSNPFQKKEVRGLGSKLQALPSKKQKAGFEKPTGDVVAMNSSKKAAGEAALKADEPRRNDKQVHGAKAPPHWQKSKKSHVQELALAARNRKSKLEHEETVIPKKRKVTTSLQGQQAAKVVYKTEEKPSDCCSSFEKNYSRLPETKGSSHECLDEKLSSHLSLGLLMRFPGDFPLPSKAQLEAMFLPFGPLQTASTRLYKDSSAQVVFKHGRDAESALKHAKNNAFFGPIGVTYRLRHLPHFVRKGVTPSGKASIVSEVKPSSVEKKGGPPPSSEENTQDMEIGASVTVPILSDGAADMPTSDIQDKMMNLLRQVSVIVNPSSSEECTEVG